jgi:hypothetical protein
LFALLLVRTGPGAEVGTHYDGHEWRAWPADNTRFCIARCRQ